MAILNKHAVALYGDNTIAILQPPTEPMSKSDALIFAAWIVALAEDREGEFEEALDAIERAD